MQRRTGCAKLGSEQEEAGGAISTQPQDPPPDALQLPVEWTGVDAAPVLTANQLLVQADAPAGVPESFLLTIGMASPPPVTGTPEQQLEALRNYSAVPVRPIARISLTPGRLREWAALLQATVARLDEMGG